MSRDAILAILTESLEIDASTLPTSTAIADVPEWTSLAWLTIMSLLDEKLGVELTAKEIRSFTTIDDVLNNIAAKAPAN